MNRRTIVEMNYNHKDTRKRAEMRQELYEKSKSKVGSRKTVQHLTHHDKRFKKEGWGRTEERDDDKEFELQHDQKYLE